MKKNNRLSIKELNSPIIKDFPDGVIVIELKTRKILEINPVARKLFGYQKDELIGRDVLILHPSTYKEKIKKIISELESRFTPYLVDIPFVRKNGEIFFVDIASTKFNCNGSIIAIGFLRDRSKIIPKVCDWKLLYEQLAELTGFACCIIANRRFVYVNEKLVELLGGKTQSQFIEKEVAELIPQQDRERLNCIYESLISGAIPVAILRQKIFKVDCGEIECVLKGTRSNYNGENAAHFIIKPVIDEKEDLKLPTLTDTQKLMSTLTGRETEVLCLIARGNTLKEIAAKLKIAYHTAMTHKHNIMKKLHLQTIADITRFAIKNGIVHLE